MPIGVGAVAHHHPDVLTVVDELAGDVAAEVAVGADDERGHRAPPPVLRHPGRRLVGQRAELLGLAAPLHRRGHEPQRVVDVLLPTATSVAGVGEDRDVGRADDGAVTGIAHRVVELADDPAGRLVDDRPERRERTSCGCRGRSPSSSRSTSRTCFAATHGARRVLDVDDVGAVLRRPTDPSPGSARPDPPSPRSS